MTGADFVQMVGSLGLNDQAMARISGIREPAMLAIVRENPLEPLESLPVFSQLGLDVLDALLNVVGEIDGVDERLRFGEYLANELHTHGAGYVAMRIMETKRHSWVPDPDQS